ncbi:MAG: ATP-binding protein [Chloroflexota bacterium]
MAGMVGARTDMAALLRELRRVDALLRDRALALRARLGPTDEPYRGVYISDAEFDELLARPFGVTRLDEAPTDLPVAPAPAPGSRWAHLVYAFGLSPWEADALLLCLLPEIDLRYERLYAYLQDDVTHKRPTVDLVLNLLCPDLGARLAVRAALAPEGPLIAGRLLRLEAPEGGAASLLSRALSVEPAVAAYLLDGQPPAVVAPLHLEDRGSATEPALADGAEEPWRVLAAMSPAPGLWVQIAAHDGWTAHGCAAALARGWDLALLALDLPAAPPEDELARLAALARREALLHGAALYVDAGALPLADETAPWVPFAQALARHPLPVLWRNGLDAPPLTQLPAGACLARLELPRPEYPRRLALWRAALGAAPLDPDASLEALASRYRLGDGQIHEAALLAQHSAWQRAPGQPIVAFDDLSQAARLVSSTRLGQLARHVEVRHDWDDLILPTDREAQLREICDQYKFRHRVYDEWRFGRKLSLGRGLSALFAGPSGTGKTMAAEVMAHELALDLYKIDLSGVVSKYIGETEKNLERIFELARDSNAILLFDEADALFGKRSETKDAHDRYANIEISYLLQKIEEYDGVVILTSNLRQNLDEAFLRRLGFTVEFPLPDEEARLRIWRRTLPAEAPLGADVDLGELARRFRLSGGSIRNALLNAAFLAARDGAVIGRGHLLWAVRREYQKLGKLVDEGQFAAVGAGERVGV